MKKFLKWLKGDTQKNSSDDYLKVPTMPKYDIDITKDKFWETDLDKFASYTDYNKKREEVAKDFYTKEAKNRLFQTADMEKLRIEMEMERMKRQIELEKKERREAPQRAMNEFLGGVPYEEMLILAKKHYPEKFI